jgi:hypothetical protein
LRFFEGSRWVVDRTDRDEDIDVCIAGMQHHDGSVSRDIVVHQLHSDHPITVRTTTPAHTGKLWASA